MPSSDRSRPTTRNFFFLPGGFDHNAHVHAFDALYRVIDEAVPPSQIIDCTALSGPGPDFVDHIHLSDRGCAELAAIIAPRLALPALSESR